MWHTDLSLINAIEMSDIVPLTELDDEKAAQLLYPIQGTCAVLKVDIWAYVLCADWFTR